MAEAGSVLVVGEVVGGCHWIRWRRCGSFCCGCGDGCVLFFFVLG